jgi:DNA-binding NarL/FixJ family response regulator
MPASQPQLLPVSPTRAPATVLVVEEHVELRAALRDWLLTSFPPLRLREACSMEEALRLAGQAELDLALVNVELPGPNGIETARELRRRFPRCAVIVMSLHDSEALCQASLAAGAAAFVPKRELTTSLLPILDRLLKS